MADRTQTSSSAELKAEPEVSASEVQHALDALLADALRPICLGLALFYALISTWYVGQFAATPEPALSDAFDFVPLGLKLTASAIRPLSTGLVSLCMLSAAVWFSRNRLPANWAHPAAALLGCCVIASCLILVVTGADPLQTTNLMVAQIGFGCLLFSFRWYAGLSTLALGGWLLVVGGRRAEADWYHFGLALCEATLFGALVLWVRLRAQRRVQQLYLGDQILKQQLRAANEAARSAVRAKSEFLANMSHEIRTPMTAMLGMTELLQMTELDEAQRDYADTVARSGETLLQLVNDILDFSKIEAEQLMIERVDFDLNELLQEVREMLEVKARQRGLSLRVEIAGDVPRRLQSDPTRIRQIMVNLVGNAIKFTHQGHVALRARAIERLAADGCTIELAVEDTGIGIAKDQQAKVFEAFTQADTSTTRRYGGTGLGLAISNRLTQLLGGTLSLESEPGRGSTFLVRLPMQVVDAPAEQQAEARSSSAPPKRFAARVLIVEDNQENQALAVRLLQHFGCSVDAASNGEQALAQLQSQNYDLVFMDCHMPVLNGYDATREIRKRESGQRHMTIIALSASVLPEERQRCLDVGMDDYVAKPFSRHDLQQALERWL